MVFVISYLNEIPTLDVSLSLILSHFHSAVKAKVIAVYDASHVLICYTT